LCQEFYKATSVYEKALLFSQIFSKKSPSEIHWWWPIKATVETWSAIICCGLKTETLLVVLSGHNQLQPQSSIQTVSVAPTNRIYSCHLISSWDTLLPRDRVNVLLCTHKHTCTSGEFLPPLWELFIAAFSLSRPPAESQQRGRKTHLPGKRYQIVQITRQILTPTPVQSSEALVYVDETRLDFKIYN